MIYKNDLKVAQKWSKSGLKMLNWTKYDPKSGKNHIFGAKIQISKVNETFLVLFTRNNPKLVNFHGHRRLTPQV